MKRLVPPFVLLAGLAVALIVSSPNAANGQSAGLVSSVLNRMENNRRSLKSLKASVSMEKYNAQLRDKDNYSGFVLYMRRVAATLRFESNGRNHSMRFWQFPRVSTRCFAHVSCRRSPESRVR